jgi:hypothetical protein
LRSVWSVWLTIGTMQEIAPPFAVEGCVALSGRSLVVEAGQHRVRDLADAGYCGSSALGGTHAAPRGREIRQLAGNLT